MIFIAKQYAFCTLLGLYDTDSTLPSAKSSAQTLQDKYGTQISLLDWGLIVCKAKLLSSNF